MAYATSEDVAALAPQLPSLTPTSKPSQPQVEAYVAATERQVDARLANLGYVVPITGEQSVAIVRDIVAHGALARTLRGRAFVTNNPGDLAGAKAAQDYFDAQFVALADPEDSFELPDAERTGEAVEKDPSDIIAESIHASSRHCDVRPLTRNMVF